MKRETGQLALIELNVNNLLAESIRLNLLLFTKQMLLSCSKMKSFGKCRVIFRIKIYLNRPEESVFVSHDQYVKKSVARIDISNASSGLTSMELYLDLHKKFDSLDKLCRKAIGSVCHLFVSTRPCIPFAGARVPNWHGNQTMLRLSCVKNDLCFHVGTSEVGLRYDYKTESAPSMCIDANWANDSES